MKHGMKTYVLLAVSLLMLAAGTFPHHHHGEKLCTDSDLETCMPPLHRADDSAHYPGDEDKHACGSTCITRFSVPSFHHRTDCTPGYSSCTLLFFPPCTVPDGKEMHRSGKTIRNTGKLHARHCSDVRNFRAPPTSHS